MPTSCFHYQCFSSSIRFTLGWSASASTFLPADSLRANQSMLNADDSVIAEAQQRWQPCDDDEREIVSIHQLIFCHATEYPKKESLMEKCVSFREWMMAHSLDLYARFQGTISKISQAFFQFVSRTVILTSISLTWNFRNVFTFHSSFPFSQNVSPVMTMALFLLLLLLSVRRQFMNISFGCCATEREKRAEKRWMLLMISQTSESLSTHVRQRTTVVRRGSRGNDKWHVNERRKTGLKLSV